MDTTTAELRIGAYRLNLEQRRLLIDGQPVKLGGRAFNVLLALVERRERAVSKDELFELVWPGLVVEENNLQVHISALRKLLGPHAIATIPGRGYRFAVSPDTSADETVPKPPPAPAAPTTLTNLPALQKSLYGRANDIDAISELLRMHPLVSIVGAGGIGKTRLALAVADAQRRLFADGVWWIELAALSDGALVAGAIAQAVGLRTSGERPVLETAVALLRNQTVLLVLDNCEHLLDAAAECVNTLLRDAPALRILVTSQEALRTPDEQVYRLGGLQIAAAGEPDAASAAVQLFVARAQSADPRWLLSTANLATVAEICHRLDGMPLAIELAAARVRLLGIEGLRARLDERFHLLTGGARSVPRRHQTLHAALEWSHGLLEPDEQTVFRRLGVFVGGFTLELAQDVASDQRIDRWAVLDLLGHLVDKSLVVADSSEVPRYELLETMREFALEKLAAADETLVLLRRHAEALLAFVKPLDEQPWTWNTSETARYGAELDNLRAALDWAESSSRDRVLGCELIGSSRRIWTSYDLNESIERALRMLPLPAGLAPEIEARFNQMLGSVGYLSARRECFDASLRAAELYRSLGEESRQIDALIDLVHIGARLGEAQQCDDAIARAEALTRPNMPPRQAAALELAKGRNYLSRGQHEEALASSLRQAALYRQNGHDWGVQLALSNAAWCECALGRFDPAIAQLRSALEELRRLNAPYGVAQALGFLACAHALRGDSEEALATGRLAVPQLQRGLYASWILLFMSLVHARTGAAAKAAALTGYFDIDFARAGRNVVPMYAHVRDEIVERARAALGPTEFDRQTAAGAALTEDRAIALAFDAGAKA